MRNRTEAGGSNFGAICKNRILNEICHKNFGLYCQYADPRRSGRLELRRNLQEWASKPKYATKTSVYIANMRIRAEVAKNDRTRLLTCPVVLILYRIDAQWRWVRAGARGIRVDGAGRGAGRAHVTVPRIGRHEIKQSCRNFAGGRSQSMRGTFRPGRQSRVGAGAWCASNQAIVPRSMPYFLQMEVNSGDWAKNARMLWRV